MSWHLTPGWTARDNCSKRLLMKILNDIGRRYRAKFSTKVSVKEQKNTEFEESQLYQNGIDILNFVAEIS